MKKLAIATLIVLSSAASAAAQSVGYVGSDGFYYIRGLTPGKPYSVNLGGMPLIKAGVSNSCGILQIRSSKAFGSGDRFEIKDEASRQTYGFVNQNLSTRQTERCNGQPTQTREVWKTPDGAIAISGLTPKSAQTIRLLSNNQARNLRTNLCGFLKIKLDNPAPPAIITDGKAYPTSGQAGRGIACVRNILYLAYPPVSQLIAISPVDETTWKQQNQPAFSSGVSVIVGSSSSSNNDSASDGGSSSGGSGTGGVTTDVITAPSPLPEPSPEPAPAPAPSPPPDPKPPAGQVMCKVGTQLVAIVPSKNYKHYAATEEDSSYVESDSDSNGKVIFNGINFEDVSLDEGSSLVEIGAIDPTAEEWDNRIWLGSRYVMRLSVVQPCQ